jgi:hypothetical protein
LVLGRLSAFEYSLGLVNGSGINKKDDNNHKDFSGRFVAHLADNFAAGFSIYNGRQTIAGVSSNLVRNKYGLEGTWEYHWAYLSTEFIWAKDGQVESHGWYLLAIFNLRREKYQLVFRLDSVDLDRSLPGQSKTIYLAGINWYWNPWSKFQANFEYHHPAAGPDNQVILLQLQVGF